jgi:putative ABC transport system substrate-binding protein
VISRRTFGTLVVGVLAAAVPLPGRAQQNPGPAPTGRAARIGALFSERDKPWLLQALHDAGYDEGRNLIVEFRSVSPAEMLPSLAAELVALDVDVIVALGSQAVRAAQQATQRIPIVMAASSDPVGTGFVASLARPGGNITGMSLFSPELSGKRLELLREIAGDIRRVAVLWNPDDPPATRSLKETDAARILGIELRAFEIRRVDDFDAAFASATEARPNAVVILPAPLLSTNGRRVAVWALHDRLPAIDWQRDFPASGGLMSYGPTWPAWSAARPFLSTRS